MDIGSHLERIGKRLETSQRISNRGPREVLRRCRGIEKHWFKILTEDQLRPIVPTIHQIDQDFFKALRLFKRRPLEGPEGSWHEALEAAWRESRRMCVEEGNLRFWQEVWDWVFIQAQKSALKRAEDIDRQISYYRLRTTVETGARAAAENLARAATWELGRNRLQEKSGPLENPFLPFLDLYQQGAASVNLCGQRGEEELTVDFPLRKNGKIVVGCLAFSPDLPDLPEILFHKWGQTCWQRSETIA